MNPIILAVMPLTCYLGYLHYGWTRNRPTRPLELLQRVELLFSFFPFILFFCSGASSPFFSIRSLGLLTWVSSSGMSTQGSLPSLLPFVSGFLLISFSLLTIVLDAVWASFFGLIYRKFFWDFVGGTLRDPGGLQWVYLLACTRQFAYRLWKERLRALLFLWQPSSKFP